MLLLSVHHAKNWPHGTVSILGDPDRGWKVYLCSTSIRKEYSKWYKFFLEKLVVMQEVKYF
jgi:hypothetical protein